MKRHEGVFPFAPLGAVLERVFPEIAVDGGQFAPAGDLRRASEVLGLTRETLTRYKAGKLLSASVADQCAIRLGLHPAVIWWDYNQVCDQLDAEADERRAASIAKARARVRLNRELAHAGTR